LKKDHPVRLTPATPPWRGIKQNAENMRKIPLCGGVPTKSAGWSKLDTFIIILLY